MHNTRGFGNPVGRPSYGIRQTSADSGPATAATSLFADTPPKGHACPWMRVILRGVQEWPNSVNAPAGFVGRYVAYGETAVVLLPAGSWLASTPISMTHTTRLPDKSRRVQGQAC
jgi:hypothetical protein